MGTIPVGSLIFTGSDGNPRFYNSVGSKLKAPTSDPDFGSSRFLSGIIPLVSSKKYAVFGGGAPNTASKSILWTTKLLKTE